MSAIKAVWAQPIRPGDPWAAPWLRGLALVLVAASVTACSKPNPPLLAPGQADALAGLKSPYAVLDDHGDGSAGATDVMVLQQGAALRQRVRRGVQDYAGIRWQGPATLPSTVFADFEHPTVDCPSASTAGDICTLTFAPRPTDTPLTGSAATPQLQLSAADLKLLAGTDLLGEARNGVMTIRFDIDPGGKDPIMEPPLDPRPLLSGGERLSRIVSGEVELPRLGARQIVCHQTAVAGATWERRNCSVEYGPVRMTIGRDVDRSHVDSKDAAFEHPGDDPVMVAALREGTQMFIDVVRDPVLKRAFPPLRPENNPIAIFGALTGAEGLDDLSAIRKEVTANGAILPWHDVTNQIEFDTLCADAAAKRLPLLIVTADGDMNVPRQIYADVYRLFAPRTMLVLVREAPPAGQNLWAKAFAAAIGAEQGSTITVTDKPKWSGKACKVGKVYQTAYGKAKSVEMMGAVLHGSVPKSNAKM